MRSKKEIKEKKQEDLLFITSAITTELHNLAYIEYFETWENNGGMGWFFQECVEIANKVMFSEGSQYLKWLDHWKETKGNNWKSFSELTGETCFDWYHMDEALKEFQSRYEKDECIKEQVSERIGHLINEFDSEEDRNEVLNSATKFAKENRDRKKLNKIINDLKELNADNETLMVIKNRLNLV